MQSGKSVPDVGAASLYPAGGSVRLFAGQYPVITHPAFIVFALIGDALVLALRWSEKINWFVLVALAAAVVLWIVGIIINKPLLK